MGKYEDLIKRLRHVAQLADKGLVIMPSVCLEAANAIGAVAKDFIEGEYVSCANFLSEIINESEKEAAGTDDVVRPIAERYLAFDNIDFAGEEKRAAHVPTSSDFIIMVGKYLPCDDIKFTPIWVNVEWEELYTE